MMELILRSIVVTGLIFGLGPGEYLAAQEGLKDFAPQNFYIGGVLHGADESFANEDYRGVALQHFNAVTSSVYMPWGVWNGPDQDPDFDHFVAVVDWAIQHDRKVHGHTLLYPWANSQSEWWKKLENDQLEDLLQRYITELASARAGNIWVWDVVNEVIAADGQAMDDDGLRTDFREYQAIGPAYVEKAFRWAAAADPGARLILNSTGCERMNSKSDRLFHYVVKLKERGVPIHGVGFQFHFIDINSPAPDIASMVDNLQRFADAGFEIYITEMDVCTMHVSDPAKQKPTQGQLRRQQTHYQKVLEMALAQPACKAVLFWDYADDYSWLHPATSRIYNLPPNTYSFPAPFWGGRGRIKAKPAVRGMLKALQGTPPLDR